VSEKTAKLRQQRREALTLQTQLGDVLERINDELHHQLGHSSTYLQSSNMLWSWRPELWTVPCPSSSGTRGAKRWAPHVKHQGVFDDADCAGIIKQLRNDVSQGFAPYGVALELFQFDGSFLSLAIDLTDYLCGTFAKDELIGLSGEIFVERATGFTVRLNIKHGPNTEQLMKVHDVSHSDTGVEFDLEHLKINVTLGKNLVGSGV